MYALAPGPMPENARFQKIIAAPPGPFFARNARTASILL
jgi:hypothetical protein